MVIYQEINNNAFPAEENFIISCTQDAVFFADNNESDDLR